MNARSRRALAPLLALLLIAAGGLPAPAGAASGTYHVWGCRLPSGAPAPTSGWGLVSVLFGGHGLAGDTCASGGALVAAWDAVARPKNDRIAWEFHPPAATVIDHARVWRTGSSVSGAGSADLLSIVASNDYPGGVLWNAYGTSVGDSSQPFASANLVEAGAERFTAPSSYVGAVLSCSGAEGQGGCAESAGIVMRASDITLRDTSAPVVLTAGGSLALAPGAVVGGPSSFTVAASDAGSGLSRLVLTVDGADVTSAPFPDARGTCASIAGGYTDVVPCPAAATATLADPLIGVSTERHSVAVLIEDAAGNRTAVVDAPVIVKNQPLGPGLISSLRGDPNGTPALDTAGLRAWWTSKSHRRTTAAAWSSKCTSRLEGDLRSADGRGVAGAAVSVVGQPAQLGAGEVALGTATTDAAGHLRFAVPRAAGSMKVFARWRARTADELDAAADAVTLRISAGISLAVSPKRGRPGQQVRFSGRLLGRRGVLDQVPVRIEVRSGGRWRTFTTTQTDAKGRWSKRLRFSTVPGAYPVRARTGTSTVYPYAPGASPPVTVRVGRR